MPRTKFADGPEIYEHCRRIVEHFGLYDHAIFSTQVRNHNWDDEIQRWQVSTNRDDIRARFVVLASGPFDRPKLPGIPGMKDPAGHSFHSSRWDDYTGGDTAGGMHKPADKGVAIIGTGATSVQVAPHLARDAAHQSRLGQHAAARLAERTTAQLPLVDVRGHGTGRPGLADARGVHGDPRGGGLQGHVIVPAAVTPRAASIDTSAYPPMGPELVAPAVGWLSHESCSMTGEAMIALAGRIARAVAAEAPRGYRPSWSIEDVDAHARSKSDGVHA